MEIDIEQLWKKCKPGIDYWLSKRKKTRPRIEGEERHLCCTETSVSIIERDKQESLFDEIRRPDECGSVLPDKLSYNQMSVRTIDFDKIQKTS